MTPKVDISVSLNETDTLPIAELGVPEVLVVDSSSIPQWTVDNSTRTNCCIYCGSDKLLSDEHVLPYALGGTVLVWKGSCEVCRLKTQAFENAALNGEMQGARYVAQLPSRTRHRKAKKEIVLEVVRNGDTFVETFSATEVPTLLTLPIFGLPRYFAPREEDTRMRLEGTVGVSFGKDPDEFLRALGAETVRFPPGNSAPVQFARMIAKIAYGAAWLDNQLDRVSDPGALSRAFLDEPDMLGRFVGTLPPPYTAHPEVGHRFQIYRNTQDLLCCETQLFASAGSPTYVVVLGRIVNP